jgi:hypothetical protein
MNILDIIVTEASDRPIVKKIEGKYSIVMPDGRKIGSYDSVRAAQDDFKNRPGLFKAPKTPGKAVAQTGRITFEKFKRYLKDRNDPAWRKLGYQTATKKVGMWLKILKVFGYSEMVYDYWTDMAALDEMYQGRAKDQDYYDIQGNLISTLAVQITASGLISRIVKHVISLRWLFRALGLGATIGTGGFGGGAAIAGILASEVALIAVQRYLNQEEVRKTIATVIAHRFADEWDFLNMPGSALAKQWNKLKDGISNTIDEAMGKKKTEPQSGQTARPDPSKPTTPGQTPTQQGAANSGTGKYSQYTTDPELKAALQAQGL